MPFSDRWTSQPYRVKRVKYVDVIDRPNLKRDAAAKKPIQTETWNHTDCTGPFLYWCRVLDITGGYKLEYTRELNPDSDCRIGSYIVYTWGHPFFIDPNDPIPPPPTVMRR